VSLPDLAGASTAAQQQLRDAYAALTTKIEERGVSDADLGSAYGDMGKLLMAAEYRDAAEPCLVNAERLLPSEFRWPYYLGHLYNAKGEGAKAAASFEHALRLNQADATALVSLGDEYLDLGRADDAARLFARAKSLDPQSATARFGLGRAALAREDYARAVEELEEALSLDPKAGVIHYPLAMAYRAMSRIDKAEAHLRQQGTRPVQARDALMEQLDALVHSAAAFEVRGVRALDEARWMEAAEDFRKAVELSPDDPRLRQKLGTALSLGGDTAGAVREFIDITQRWPTFANAQYSLGVLLMSAGRSRDAIEHLSVAVKGNPTYVQARLQLAEALRASGAFERSLLHYEEAAVLDPRIPEVQFGYAMALAGLKRFVEARACLERAMQLYPDQPGFAEAMVRLLAAAPDDHVRDGAAAMAITQRLLTDQQPSVAVVETVAMAFAEVGKYAEAVKWERKAMSAVQQAGRSDLLPYLAYRLSLYERGQPCRAPWGDEIAVLTL
jgi:tetratricopeptide (TPR) repeat protein